MKNLTFKQECQVYKVAESMPVISVEDEGVAFITLMRICMDYVNNDSYPLIRDHYRDEWLMERLRKYRIRFFDKI